jgi:hypothetical protein
MALRKLASRLAGKLAGKLASRLSGRERKPQSKGIRRRADRKD